MKIVQINAIYKKGSTGRNALEMHQYFLSKGFESYVAAAQQCADSNFIKIGNPLDWKIHALLARVTGLEGYFSLHSTKKLIKRLDLIKPDVVYIQNIHSNFLNFSALFSYLARHNIATVITAIDFFLITGKCTHFCKANCEKWKWGCKDCPQLKGDIPSWFFDKTSKMWSDKKTWLSAIPRLGIVGASDWTVGFIKKSFLGGRYHIKRIYNWIDLSCFKHVNPESLKKQYALEGKTILLGVASVWTEEKGLSSFLTLAQFLPPQYQIVLVGKIQNKAMNLSNILSIPETDSVNELVEFYSLANIFLQMSRMETFGKVTAEALSCGTPVIALDSTSNAELVSKECGAVVSNDDPELLLRTIQALQSKDQIKLRNNCRSYACDHFSKEICIGSYIKLFEDLISKNN
jgi:glycosyltransferase involved in cell wall biosynthesis